MPTARATVTVSETIEIARSPEEVFDYTQDYGTRSDWDPSVTEATLLSDEPRAVRVTVKGVGRFTVEYRLFRRGDRTSAAFVDVDSAWIARGGGSWRYEPTATGTAWTQTNTFELKRPRLLWWLAPFVRRSLRSSMRDAMRRAKTIMEERPGEAGVAARLPRSA